MSRIGKKPIIIDNGVEVKIDGNLVNVKGPKGQLSLEIAQGVEAVVNNNEIIVNLIDPLKNNLWGLTRTLISNMIIGVTKGYEKQLMLFGVGYNVKLQGNKLIFNLGYSHPIDYELPNGISAKLEKDPKGNDIITLSSIDKQHLGQIAAKIKTFRKIEPYKGKGIRYKDQVIKLKAGKTAKK